MSHFSSLKATKKSKAIKSMHLFPLHDILVKILTLLDFFAPLSFWTKSETIEFWRLWIVHAIFKWILTLKNPAFSMLDANIDQPCIRVSFGLMTSSLKALQTFPHDIFWRKNNFAWSSELALSKLNQVTISAVIL